MKNIKFFKENEGKLSEYSTTEEKVFTAEVPQNKRTQYARIYYS